MAYWSVAPARQPVLFLVAACRRLAGWMPGASSRQVSGPAHAQAEGILERHLQLDAEIDGKLAEVVEETEGSALAVMQQVRQLHDTATRLVTYLDGTSQESGTLGNEIVQSVAFLGDISAFIEQLPAKMERDLHEVQNVAHEIDELNGLTKAVQAISMQSHLLAINAAIEAGRAGPEGKAFRVVADEMRKLASDSGDLGHKITQGLARARHVVEHGITSGIEESRLQLEQVSAAAVSIGKLRGNFDALGQHFSTRIGVVTQHNESLVHDISEVLGQMQTQDVVRQRIDRVRAAIGQRNVLLRDAVRRLGTQEGADLAHLPGQLALVLDGYLAEEMKHRGAGDAAQDDSTERRIELF